VTIHGIPTTASTKRRWPEAKALWEKLFLTRTRDEWAALLEQSDACVAPVLALDEAPTTPTSGRGRHTEPVGR
jgi:alpha-methylacyl-CoA racemase